MIVGIDLQSLVRGASGGISQWLGGVIRAYATEYPDDRLLLFEPDDFSFDWAWPSSVERISGARASLHRLEYDTLRSRSGDVLIRGYPDIHDPGFPMERQIVAVPDMQHAERPEFFSPPVLRIRRLAFGRILSEVAAVATMTEFSRESILRYPWTGCSDVFLMPPAVDLDLVTQASEGSETNAAWEAAVAEFSGYFFMPANPWPHKNHRRLFEAFALARPRLPAGAGLVLTGTGDEWPRVLSGFEHLPIRHLGYVSRADLARLYRRAQALVFFSMYEGFGIPLLEAFHFGTPVLCSNIPPVVEVGRDAVLSCAPDDVAAMSEQMVRIAADAGMRRTLIARGKERLQSFSWTRSARALHDAIRRVEAGARGERPVAPTNRFGGRVSVILDAAQGGPVGAAVEAVIGQSHRDWELLVVSTDRHPPGDLPDDPRIRLVVDGNPNGAVRGAAALALAHGDARLYLRPDCILAEDALARIAARFRETPACDVVACATASIDRAGNVVARWSMPPLSPDRMREDPSRLPSFTFESNLTSCLGGDFRALRPIVAWRRRIEDLEPGFDPAMPFAFDADYWLRLMRAGGNLAVIDDSMATIRLSDDPAGARFWYRVMRDCETIARRRSARIGKRFFRLLHYRRFGLDPSATHAWRWLPSVLGWRDYWIDSARRRMARLAHRVRRLRLG